MRPGLTVMRRLRWLASARTPPPRSFVDRILWPEFEQLNAALIAYLSDVTDRIIREEVYGETGDADEIDETPRIGR